LKVGKYITIYAENAIYRVVQLTVPTDKAITTVF